MNKKRKTLGNPALLTAVASNPDLVKQAGQTANVLVDRAGQTASVGVDAVKAIGVTYFNNLAGIIKIGTVVVGGGVALVLTALIVRNIVKN